MELIATLYFLTNVTRAQVDAPPLRRSVFVEMAAERRLDYLCPNGVRRPDEELKRHINFLQFTLPYNGRMSENLAWNFKGNEVGMQVGLIKSKSHYGAMIETGHRYFGFAYSKECDLLVEHFSSNY